MLSHELRAREAKLRKEQQERVEKEKQRKEKEKLLQDRQRQREAEREAERSQRVQEQLEAARQAQERMEQLTEDNRGVYYTAMLQAVPQDAASIAARGIKRVSDKVSLPASVGALLMEQGAPRNGAPLFEIRTPGGTVTHAGALEFTAPEGVVALPRKVADCLWGAGAPVSGPVTVTYKRLDKGTFVRFQPLTRGFHEAVGERVREVLEQALMQFTVLTEGDVIRVDCSDPNTGPSQMDVDSASTSAADAAAPSAAISAGAAAASGQLQQPLVFDMLVQELQPSSAVSLIDTDMEAQVVPSLETEQALHALEEQRAKLEQQRQERERVAAEALREQQRQAQRHAAAQEQAAAEEQQRRERQRAVLEATLPPEPPSEPLGAGTGVSGSQGGDGAGQQGGVATAVFRLPDGARVSRRFALSSPAALLFHFCDAKGAGGLAPGSYRLVMQYPRRVVEPGFTGNLAAAGLVSGQQEALMLEPLGTGGAGAVSGEGSAAATGAGAASV